MAGFPWACPWEYVKERNEKRIRDLFDTLLRTNLMKYDLMAAGDTECPG
ncbi:MAG: hypothetical protein SOZ46_07400 [Bullifex sp.]|nr:hypothetical protein [Spirochaetales bacterium]MDY2816030.1 hypothetical protein [Bullifex sp.]MDY3850626.1 hypothetical protein [Bullifex sp.]MDY4799961.1 hypothetical protein [Bullifex sp.]MDY5057528.1 hypothetical protein [Bullifex sp.]